MQPFACNFLPHCYLICRIVLVCKAFQSKFLQLCHRGTFTSLFRVPISCPVAGRQPSYKRNRLPSGLDPSLKSSTLTGLCRECATYLLSMTWKLCASSNRAPPIDESPNPRNVLRHARTRHYPSNPSQGCTILCAHNSHSFGGWNVSSVVICTTFSILRRLLKVRV